MNDNGRLSPPSVISRPEYLNLVARFYIRTIRQVERVRNEAQAAAEIARSGKFHIGQAEKAAQLIDIAFLNSGAPSGRVPLSVEQHQQVQVSLAAFWTVLEYAPQYNVPEAEIRQLIRYIDERMDAESGRNADVQSAARLVRGDRVLVQPQVSAPALQHVSAGSPSVAAPFGVAVNTQIHRSEEQDPPLHRPIPHPYSEAAFGPLNIASTSQVLPIANLPSRASPSATIASHFVGPKHAIPTPPATASPDPGVANPRPLHNGSIAPSDFSALAGAVVPTAQQMEDNRRRRSSDAQSRRSSETYPRRESGLAGALIPIHQGVALSNQENRRRWSPVQPQIAAYAPTPNIQTSGYRIPSVSPFMSSAASFASPTPPMGTVVSPTISTTGRFASPASSTAPSFSESIPPLQADLNDVRSAKTVVKNAPLVIEVLNPPTAYPSPRISTTERFTSPASSTEPLNNGNVPASQADSYEIPSAKGFAAKDNPVVLEVLSRHTSFHTPFASSTGPVLSENASASQPEGDALPAKTFVAKNDSVAVEVLNTRSAFGSPPVFNIGRSASPATSAGPSSRKNVPTPTVDLGNGQAAKVAVDRDNPVLIEVPNSHTAFASPPISAAGRLTSLASHTGPSHNENVPPIQADLHDIALAKSSVASDDGLVLEVLNGRSSSGPPIVATGPSASSSSSMAPPLSENVSATQPGLGNGTPAKIAVTKNANASLVTEVSDPRTASDSPTTSTAGRFASPASCTEPSHNANIPAMQADSNSTAPTKISVTKDNGIVTEVSNSGTAFDSAHAPPAALTASLPTAVLPLLSFEFKPPAKPIPTLPDWLSGNTAKEKRKEDRAPLPDWASGATEKIVEPEAPVFISSKRRRMDNDAPLWYDKHAETTKRVGEVIDLTEDDSSISPSSMEVPTAVASEYGKLLANSAKPDGSQGIAVSTTTPAHLKHPIGVSVETIVSTPAPSVNIEDAEAAADGIIRALEAQLSAATFGEMDALDFDIEMQDVTETRLEGPRAPTLSLLLNKQVETINGKKSLGPEQGTNGSFETRSRTEVELTPTSTSAGHSSRRRGRASPTTSHHQIPEGFAFNDIVQWQRKVWRACFCDWSRCGAVLDNWETLEKVVFLRYHKYGQND